MAETVTTIEPLEIEECFSKVTSKFETPKYNELTFKANAYLKLMFFIHLVGDYEVSGYGKIVDGKIVDLYLPKQTLSKATAKINEDAMVEFLAEIPTKELKYWELDWHSHVDMGTSPSSTDKDNYKDQAEARGNKQFVAMIVNKSESMWCKDVISGVKFTDIELKCEPIDLDFNNKEIKQLYEECKEIVKEKCHKQITVTIKTKEEEQEDKKQLKLWKKNKKQKETCSVCGRELRDWEHGKCWECKRDEYYDYYGYEYTNHYTNRYDNY